MGTPGMRYSLVSREVIADSIETVVGAQGFDGVVAIGGCDKNMPGCMMALARLDRPAVFVYGGTIRPGADNSDIVFRFRGGGGHARGTVSSRQIKFVERRHTGPAHALDVYRQYDGFGHRGHGHESAELVLRRTPSRARSAMIAGAPARGG